MDASSKPDKSVKAETTSAALNRLAAQLLNQRVVFFVGAGFSIDSEQVRTDKIMRSLLCRFLALTDAKAFGADALCGQLRWACSQLLGLNIKDKKLTRLAPWCCQKTIQQLSQDYYEANEWMVDSFDRLYHFHSDNGTDYAHITKLEIAIRAKFVRFHSWEEKLCARAKGEAEPKAKNELDIMIKLTPLDQEQVFLQSLGKDCHGKVIFIETVGFGNPDVMQAHDNTDDLTARPRYQVFAKLAREGLLPTVMTTNYDQLIEQGYHQLGLPIILSDKQKKSDPSFTHLPQFALSIKQPGEFFQHTASLNPAHIVKIHGCVCQYRYYKDELLKALKKEPGKSEFEGSLQFKQFHCYLESIVYTYREIQHWRDDDWSRDYLQTLLRTRTLVFCGYSNADPVMHNTIRSIYEEIARKRIKRPVVVAGVGLNAMQDSVSNTKPSRPLIPAFSTGKYGTVEFNSLEILKAASRAVGVSPDLHKHPNLIEFHFGTETFPNCDMVFRTLMHRTLRQLQVQMLANQMDDLMLSVFGHPKTPTEAQTIIDNFKRIVKREKKAELLTSGGSTWALEHQLGWTEIFYQQFLKLCTAANDLKTWRVEKPQMPNADNYIPFRQHPLWMCWGIIIELAIRNASEHFCAPDKHLQASGKPLCVSDKQPTLIRPIADLLPTVDICPVNQGPVRIVLACNHLRHQLPRKVTHCIDTKVWLFDITASLWDVTLENKMVPSKEIIWQLACGKYDDNLNDYFGYK